MTDTSGHPPIRADAILRDRTPYRDPSTTETLSDEHRDRLARRLRSKLQAFGYTVQINKAAPQESVS
jgi:hypothetical protein